MKQFDDIFRENVEKAFSSFDAGHLADEGWKSFAATNRGGRKKGFIIPFWARAASIALIVGTGTLIAYLSMNSRMKEDILFETTAAKIFEQPATTQPETAISAPIAAITDTDRATEVKKAMQPLLQPDNMKMIAAWADASDTPRQREVNQVNIDTNAVPAVFAEKVTYLPGDSLNLVVEEAMKELLETILAETATVEEEKHVGRTTFMAGLSGLLAKSEDAASSVPGLSVGFYLDRKITEKISFRPGLALAMHSFGLEEMDGGSRNYYSPPLADGSSGTPGSYSGQLSMIVMEVPMNIVFKVLERGSSSLYLSTGASTMFYINQQFAGDYVNEYTQQKLNTVTGEKSYESRYSTVSVNNDYGAFSRTDYFGLANLSAGYSVPYGKTGTLIIEPFLQLPLSDLTAMDLRVRYGGLSMKVRFGSHNSRK